MLLVTIDLECVRANLSREAGRAASEADVAMFLFESGFRRWDDQWLVPEGRLYILGPGEMTAAVEPPHDARLETLILSTEYEDHLDWLENRRRLRTRAGRRRSLLEGLNAALAALMKAVTGFRRQ
jgi:hypothetical protein